MAFTENYITDYDIQALVDSELPWEEMKRVFRYMSANPEAMKRYEELRHQKRLLINWSKGRDET